MENQNYVPAPDNHLVKSILVLLFCCLPFGIVALVHATKVDSMWASGQQDAARHEAAEADKWANYGLYVGIACGVIYLIIMLIGVLSGL